jgi:polyisoprenoid-binding protein YceI
MLKKLSLLLVFGLCTLTAIGFAPVTYSVDAAHSNVGFSIPILNGLSHVRGKFTDFKIDVDYDEADITKSKVKAVINAASIDTGIERRDAHLRNPDFFEVEKYPEITFESTRIEKKGKDFVAHGTFSMHGVSKEIAIPFTANGTFVNEESKQKMLGFTGKVELNRRDYGINYQNRSNPAFIGDMVQVELFVLLRPPPARPAG